MRRILIAVTSVFFVAASLTIGSAGMAGEAKGGQEKKGLPNQQQIVAALQSAHKLLKEADHDYDGHRHKAAVAVSKALEGLDHSVAEADSKRWRHERQALSDAQLREARKDLESAVSQFEAAEHNAQSSGTTQTKPKTGKAELKKTAAKSEARKEKEKGKEKAKEGHEKKTAAAKPKEKAKPKNDTKKTAAEPKKQHAAVAHVQAAIREIDKALEVR